MSSNITVSKAWGRLTKHAIRESQTAEAFSD